MRVRLLKPWQYRKVGSVLNEVPDGVANLLIRRKLAEEVRNENQIVADHSEAKPARYSKRVRA